MSEDEKLIMHKYESFKVKDPFNGFHIVFTEESKDYIKIPKSMKERINGYLSTIFFLFLIIIQTLLIVTLLKLLFSR